jgi:hypothetical protein
VFTLSEPVPVTLIVPVAVSLVTEVVIIPFVTVAMLMFPALNHNVPALVGAETLTGDTLPSHIVVTTAFTVPFRKSTVPVPPTLVPV